MRQVTEAAVAETVDDALRDLVAGEEDSPVAGAGDVVHEAGQVRLRVIGRHGLHREGAQLLQLLAPEFTESFDGGTIGQSRST